MKIVVSTDSIEYKEIAEKYGAEVPFIRPAIISQDTSTDYECFKHCIDWLEANQKYTPNIILHLRPTQPFRKIEDINKCMNLFMKNRDKYDSLRTVIPIEKSPYKMYILGEEELIPLYKTYNNTRQ